MLIRSKEKHSDFRGWVDSWNKTTFALHRISAWADFGLRARQ